MTGAYLRVKREGRWTNVEVEYLTNEERAGIFKGKTKEEVLRWFDLVCKALAGDHK